MHLTQLAGENPAPDHGAECLGQKGDYLASTWSRLERQLSGNAVDDYETLLSWNDSTRTPSELEGV